MFFSSKWLYLTALLLISLSKTSAMRSSVMKAESFAGTTSLTSLFLFPVTFANSLLSPFAYRKFFNKRARSIGIVKNKTHRKLSSCDLIFKLKQETDKLKNGNISALFQSHHQTKMFTKLTALYIYIYIYI